jgi:hypothetical protein
VLAGASVSGFEGRVLAGSEMSEFQRWAVTKIRGAVINGRAVARKVCCSTRCTGRRDMAVVRKGVTQLGGK